MTERNLRFEHNNILWVQRAAPCTDPETHAPEQIIKTWKPAAISTPFKVSSKYKFPTASGHYIDVTPENVSIQLDDLTPDALAALMNHIKTEWNGAAIIQILGAENHDARSLARGYAEAFGVDLYDTQDVFWQFLLTADEVARATARAKATKEETTTKAPTRPQPSNRGAYMRPYPI